MRLLILVLLMGCVPKKQYLQLESELSAARAQVSERDSTIMALTSQAAQLNGEIVNLKAALTSKEATLADLQARNAAMLKDKGALTSEVSKMRSALEELEARKAAADARLQEFRDLIERFRALIDSGTLEVKIKDGRMIVAMATDVLFASGSATLSGDGKQALTEVTRILASIPDREFQVEGHTDDDAISTAQFPNNWFLASTRSLNVVAHMLKNGMHADRISGASFGEFRPVIANDSKEHKALNRRIEIIVVPDLSQLPGYEELKALE